MNASLLAVHALWKREVLKFVRDKSRVLGALAQPLGFWLLLGFGFEHSFMAPAGTGSEQSYIEFLYPGMVALIILFTAIFSTISIVEERKSGFLQAALVAPASRITLVFGNTLGGTSLALVETLLFLLLLPAIGIIPSMAGILLVLLTTILIGLAFTSLGFVIAWRMDSTRGFHAVMNLFLLPLWLLSGAPFPIEGASPVLRWIMVFNPVTYAVSALRQAIYWPSAPVDTLVSLPLALAITSVFAIAMLALAAHTIRKPLFGLG